MRHIIPSGCAILLLASMPCAQAEPGFRLAVPAGWPAPATGQERPDPAGWAAEDWSLQLSTALRQAHRNLVVPGAPRSYLSSLATPRTSLGVQLGLPAPGGWLFQLQPSLQQHVEGELHGERSLGLVGSASKLVTPELTLGLGIGVFDELQQTRSYPYLLVDWDINPNWKLANPFATGPAGPAGLELSYRQPRWDVGAGGAYRAYRFRLAHDHALAPGGIGVEEQVPLYLRFGYAPSRDSRLDIYLGASLFGRSTTEDRDGNLLLRGQFDTEPLFAVQFGGQF